MSQSEISTSTNTSHIDYILSCHNCKSKDIIVKKSENYVHAASLRCIDCGTFRWLSKKDADRAFARLGI